MTKAQVVGISFPPELLKTIDCKRGEVGRSRYVQNAVREKLSKEEGGS